MTNNSKNEHSPLKPDTKAMGQFIEQLHGKGKSIWFQTYPGKYNVPRSTPIQSFKAKLTPNLLAQLEAANRGGSNVSIAVNNIEGDKRSNSNVRSINAAFIDSDDGNLDLQTLLSLRLAPQYVIESSPTRLHAYWLLSDCDVKLFKPLQIALANHFKTDPSICDPARVMRLPGSINLNHRTPFLTHVIHTSNHRPVTVARLVKTLKLQLPKLKRTTPIHEPSITGASTEKKVSARELKKVHRALSALSADDRLQWRRVGMAIHSAMPGSDGYEEWTSWSKRSSKFDDADQQVAWSSFKSTGGITLQSLYWLAAHAERGGGGLDDMEVAALYAKTFKWELRYDPQMGIWYAFDGVVWHSDKQAHIRAVRRMVADLSEGEGKKDPAIKRYRSTAGMKAIVSQAEYETRLHISELDFDKNTHDLAVKNGVIDLRTSAIRMATPKDYLRRCASVEYDINAKCPQWRKFLRQITCEDRELAAFLRRAVGYILYGHTKAQAFFVLEGTGENGKGVFMRTLVKLLGAYARELAPNLITSAYAGSANDSTPALMVLKGIRLGIVTELPNSRGFDTAFVKQFSGGDSITARANYGDQITFKPEGKLVISTNDMPEIAVTDKAMWRRIFPIPFKATFSGENRDDDLEEKLLAELPGILNWALAGARRYHKDGCLVSCDAVEEHKRMMRKEADTFSGWIIDCCVVNSGGRLQASKGYDSYFQYAKPGGRNPLTRKAFRERMEKSGYHRRSTNKCNVYLGLGLRP
ncbi:MAG: phage/plasmid primase, P4 family [Polaromonas sp.]|nr:phage/plasmid primase, P4 family [Polaromonas sp.]